VQFLSEIDCCFFGEWVVVSQFWGGVPSIPSSLLPKWSQKLNWTLCTVPFEA
jgi:hypothetical protein